MVINLDKISGKGTHWIALYIDPRPNKMSMEYVDSFGKSPSKDVAIAIGKFAKKNFSHLPYMLKFKTNGVKYQSVTSPNCGFFAIDFLRQRTKGIPFDEATGYKQLSQVQKGEKHIQSVKHHFGYI
jgi:Ulp1 family protease